MRVILDHLNLILNMNLLNRIWLHTTNGVILDIESADFEIPQISEVYSWLNNNKGDVHIFENQKILEHENYEGYKIAYLRESPAIYEYTSQFGTPDVHKWTVENKDSFDHFFSCFTYLKSIVGESNFTFVPVGGSRIKLENYSLFEKQRNISIVASFKKWTTGHILRHEVIEHLGQDKLDVYGSGYNNLIDEYDPKFGKIIAIAPYRYSFAIINTREDDYFTDILIDCFAVGTVPIFWGTKNIGNYFNTDGMIIFNNLSEIDSIVSKCSVEDYNFRLPAIKENMKLAKEYVSTYDWMYKNIDFKKVLNER